MDTKTTRHVRWANHEIDAITATTSRGVTVGQTAVATWQQEMKQLATREAALRFTPAERFAKRMEITNKADDTIANAIEDVDAVKKTIQRHARNLNPEVVEGVATHLPLRSEGTAAERSAALVAEGEVSRSNRERLADSVRYEPDFRAELDNIEHTATAHGAEAALASMRDLRRHARAIQAPMGTMAAISATSSRIIDRVAERGLLIEQLEKSGSDIDTLDKLRRELRSPKAKRINMLTGKEEAA